MATPMIHARSSARHFGGKPADYLDIHELIDSSGKAFPNVKHRALTHNSWFIKTMIPIAFGEVRTNSAGTEYSTIEVAQQHVLEDYDRRFIPSVDDFLSLLAFADWMDNGKNGASPPSNAGMPEKPKAVRKPRARPLVRQPINMPGRPIQVSPPSPPPERPQFPPGRYD
jgi:hypothetical protein